MAIEEIEYGSLASSTLLNNNFKDLQNQITQLSLRISANIENISQHSDIPSESDLLFHVLTDIKL